jgi:hypothetical protein
MHSRGQHGQALVFATMFLAVLTASLLWVIRSGELATRKQALVDVADAAAWSAAHWQARDLNFLAYTNRAIIANEVAIAQSVTLRSWLRFARVLTNRSANLLTIIPPLRFAVEVVKRVLTPVEGALQLGLEGSEASLAFASADIRLAQGLFHSAAGAVSQDMARATVAVNSPQMRVSAGGEVLLGRSLADALTFTRTYSGNDRARQRAVVLEALDPFVKSRSRRIQPLGNPLLRLEKRGGTELLGFDTWRGMDTFSMHFNILGGWREVPVVGESAENGRVNLQRGAHDGSWRTNRRASRNAQRALRAQRTYRGIPTLRDVSNPTQQDDRTLRTSIRLQDSRFPRLFAQSSAEVAFHRMQSRADGRSELPNLYSPYWRARLAPNRLADRLLAAQADGAAPLLLGAFE